ACGDGEARTLFLESSIGDTDGDGAPEFLDGWGHPISFLRWAPGFDSPLQQNAISLGTPTSAAWLQAATTGHDPFDLFRVDPAAFRLVPLIYSGGRDESTGLEDAPTIPTWKIGPSTMLSTSSSFPYVTPSLLPYSMVGSTYLGSKKTGDTTAT